MDRLLKIFGRTRALPGRSLVCYKSKIRWAFESSYSIAYALRPFLRLRTRSRPSWVDLFMWKETFCFFLQRKQLPEITLLNVPWKKWVPFFGHFFCPIGNNGSLRGFAWLLALAGSGAFTCAAIVWLVLKPHQHFPVLYFTSLAQCLLWQKQSRPS